jgi:hypothetical protein
VRRNTVLEVDDGAIGLIRNRYYHPTQYYGRSGLNNAELLVELLTANGLKCYYPNLTPPPIQHVPKYAPLDPAFFLVQKPSIRGSAESEDDNLKRYDVGSGNFNKHGRWELGINLQYSYEEGAVIAEILSGSVADGL